MGEINYDEKTSIKQELAKHSKIKLIGLFSDDLYKLEEKLGIFI